MLTGPAAPLRRNAAVHHSPARALPKSAISRAGLVALLVARRFRQLQPTISAPEGADVRRALHARVARVSRRATAARQPRDTSPSNDAAVTSPLDARPDS